MKAGAGKYALLYAKFIDHNDMIMPAWENIPGYDTAYDIYKECLERGVTWRELTGIKKDERVGIEI